MSEFHDLDRRVTVLEQIAADTRQGLRDLRADLDRRFDTIERRFEAMDRRFDTLRDETSRQMRWLIGIWLSGVGVLLVVMAHGFHWL